MDNVHFFDVYDSKGDIYSWGIQGDKGHATVYVNSLSNVKIAEYKGSKPADIHCTGKRALPNGLTSVYCKYKKMLQTIRQ